MTDETTTTPAPSGVRVAVSAVLFVIGLLIAPPSATAAPDALRFISDLGNRIIQVLSPDIPAGQRVSRFREIFHDDFDVAGIGRFVLGRYWPAASPQRQQQFLGLLQDYTAQAYSSQLGRVFGEERFRAIGARRNGQEVLVTSEIRHANESPTAIAWHVVDRGGQLKISDVNVDGISMKKTEHDDFIAVLQRNGGNLDGLLALLRQKTAAAH